MNHERIIPLIPPTPCSQHTPLQSSCVDRLLSSVCAAHMNMGVGLSTAEWESFGFSNFIFLILNFYKPLHSMLQIYQFAPVFGLQLFKWYGIVGDCVYVVLAKLFFLVSLSK